MTICTNKRSWTRDGGQRHACSFGNLSLRSQRFSSTSKENGTRTAIMDEPLPNPPAELKAVLPFVQRANELRAADKVIAYWCCYYAAQLGISGDAKGAEAKMYLLTLMDTLEDLKTKLADNDAVTNDAASSAYVENFALKVFVGADNEDRAGKASRATAKKFLAASQFIELLKIFGTLESEMNEKIKYAKWKAADIAKAFKEGRKPHPGPAGGDLKEEAANIQAAMGPTALDSKEEQEYLAREMAKLTTAAPDEPPIPPLNGSEMSRGASSDTQTTPALTDSVIGPNPLDSASPDADEMWKSGSKPSAETLSHSASAQQQSRRGSSDRAQIQSSSSYVSGLATSPNARPLPTPPQSDGLSIPPISAHHQMLGSSPGLDKGGASAGPGAAPASFWGVASGPSSDHEDGSGVTSMLPSVPSGHLPQFGSGVGLNGHPAIERVDPPISPGTPTLPTTPGQLPGTPSAHVGGQGGPFIPSVPSTAPTAPSVPSAPCMPTDSFARYTSTAPSAPSINPPPPVPAVYPETLDPRLSTRVQKLAKGAASAVDFEDLETARIQLRQALDILEGRTTL